MKKYSRGSKRTMKRSMRSKKMSRRRRQRGGGTVVINCQVVDDKGGMKATSTDPAFTARESGPYSVTITSTSPIKDIRFGKADPLRVGSATGVVLSSLAHGKSVIPAYATRAYRQPTLLQMRLDPIRGMSFPSGLKVTNLTPNVLGLGTLAYPVNFQITITT
jgi:hypothetical protein